ncbi:hypothetical protein Ancab_029012 [Ancistrocladus abbreviatus]
MVSTDKVGPAQTQTVPNSLSVCSDVNWGRIKKAHLSGTLRLGWLGHAERFLEVQASQRKLLTSDGKEMIMKQVRPTRMNINGKVSLIEEVDLSVWLEEGSGNGLYAGDEGCSSENCYGFRKLKDISCG